MSNGLIIAVAMGAGLAVCISLLLVFLLMFRKTQEDDARFRAAEMVILFRQGRIIDTTPDVEEMLGKPLEAEAGWPELHPVLVQRFLDLPPDLPTEDLTFSAQDDADTVLSVSINGPFTRVSIVSPPFSVGRAHRIVNMREESDQVSQILRLDPNPIWKVSAEGQVVWQNEAYAILCAEAISPDSEQCPFAVSVDGDVQARTGRVSVKLSSSDATHWFEVTSFQVGTGTVFYATTIDNLVEAEMAQRNFVQTLAKTFAHLPIGLAVFNRERRLVLFNPALVDLTRLPIDFLSAKPNLLSFFDHMRDNRMMPEPKSYSSWRGKLYEVVSAAREDRYSETWSLPSGLTYRITGRPHPDGAVAFLIEDISAEISLTRRFRSELDLTQSVLDTFDDAVVVFTRLGVQAFCNEAYRDLWNTDSQGPQSEVTVIDASRVWQDACQPDPAWADIRDYVLNLQNRKPWQENMTMLNGQNLLCMIEPVAAGATLVRFCMAGVAAGKTPDRKAEAIL